MSIGALNLEKSRAFWKVLLTWAGLSSRFDQIDHPLAKFFLYLVFRDVLKTKKAKNRKEIEQIVPLKHEIAFGELSSPRRASCNYWHVGLGGLKEADTVSLAMESQAFEF